MAYWVRNKRFVRMERENRERREREIKRREEREEMRERFCVMKRIKDERHLTSKHKNLKTATNSSFSRPPKGKNLKSKTDRKKRYANNVKKILYRESNGMITMTERPLTGDLSHSHSLTLTLPLTLSGLGRTRGRDRLSAGECRDITALAWRWCYSE
jgi:hypothetical protein